MKKLILLIVLNLSLTSCGVLNTLVGQEIVDTCPPNKVCVSSFSYHYDFDVISCIGDPVSQTVEVTVTLKNKSLPNQTTEIYSPVAYDGNGNAYNIKQINFPNSKASVWGNSCEFDSPTGILLKGTLVFRNVLPNINMLKLIQGSASSINKDGYKKTSEGYLKIKNLPITWKN